MASPKSPKPATSRPSKKIAPRGPKSGAAASPGRTAEVEPAPATPTPHTGSSRITLNSATPYPPATSLPATAPAPVTPTIVQGTPAPPCTDLGKEFPRSEAEMRAMRLAGAAAARRMIDFIDRSPTPYHVVDNVAAALRDNGFQELREQEAWKLAPGDRRFVVRSGSTVVAFVVGARSPALTGFRMVAAHTDSPTFRLKPNAERTAHGWQLLGVEPYGGAIYATWVDRDLSIAGRVLCRRESAQLGASGQPTIEPVLVDLGRPVARIASVAIHLNRKVNEDGMQLNPQKHMVPIVGIGSEPELRRIIARAIDREDERIVSWDLCLYDTHKGTLGGLDEELVLCARLDNLASSFTAMEALRKVPRGVGPTAVLALHDHEECGSRSAVGASGTLLRDVLERVAQAHPEPEPQALPRALATSWLVSADMAHAIHPSYPDLHDAEHTPRLNRGLVVKTNANQSYATSGPSAAFFAELCRRVGYEPQQFVSRSDVRGGTTVGPIISAELGVRAVDVGAPMLSMHSVRELAGVLDVHLAIRTYEELYRS